MAVACESCGQKVNEQAVKCPHCGAKRANVTPGKFTQEEVRALLTTNGQVVDETGNSLAASLLFPHPADRWCRRARSRSCSRSCARRS